MPAPLTPDMMATDIRHTARRPKIARPRLSILTIGGHPKDAVIASGGTMANHVEAGDRVVTLCPTHGLSHHISAITDYKADRKMPDLEALKAELAQELVDAAAELGVTDVRILGHDDDVPVVERQIIEEIADVIGEVLPDIIITHVPFDSVPGHAVATQMTLLAMEAASGFRRGKSYPPHKPSQVFFHAQAGRTNVLEANISRVPTHIVDITDTIHKKTAAMNRLKSQGYGPDTRMQRKLGEALDGHMGVSARVPYAEGFIAHNPSVYQTLPTVIQAARDPSHMTNMLLDSYEPQG